MYTLILKLVMTGIVSHAAFPVETVVKVYPTELECIAARWSEAERLMARARELSKELNIAINAKINGGCKRPTAIQDTSLPPESSGG